ncbi:tryptophan halogenase family protein [Catenovulum maritimum]|uniref:Tryptophan halogenase n=1 Tax=Catenovulum maritimum TaxID=1513271 RepID=A0A0J8JI53_9ALTE|nr:tryptophan halogenase family protein [Catenovulum maritimum]KMT64136.1 tryptophan halogenase [Catenovulum maritimum]
MTQDQSIEKIVIVGGGTAGWMTAAAMAKLIKKPNCTITLIESADIPTVGVGEATIPQIQLFNALLGIDENEFVKATQATFKHGIEFVNWKQNNHKYMHPFGTIGLNFEGVDFHHYWNKLNQTNQAGSIEDYAFNCVAAYNHKMMRSINVPNSPLNNIAYAFHFDAGLYAKWLRNFAEKNGVIRIENTVQEVKLDSKSGFINSVELADGQVVEGELFIDCSGFKGLLIEEALNTGYEHWGHWLPCDRAVVAPSKNVADPVPYTRSTAHGAGWQWRIPLQHRTGNGHVYSSRFMSDDEAKQTLLDNIEGQVLTEPRVVKFTTGTRRKHWNKNCVAIGLSSGFIEPLESTSIHLIQSSISRLMSLFPDKSFEKSVIDTFNSQTKLEVERIRDFIILHYKVTEREDTEFWRYCKNMEVPAYLEQKIKLFSQTGRIFRQDDELFNQSSWLAVMLGQGITPEAYHPLVDNLSLEEIRHRCDNIKKVIKESVERMPKQSEFINKFCRANLESV